MMRPRPSWIQFGAALALLTAAAALAGIYRVFSLWGELAAHGAGFVALSLVAGIIYLTACYVTEHYRVGGAGLVVILAGALLFRILLLPLWPSLSQDLYRYRWQGRVHQAGLNPYTVTPSTPGLEKFLAEDEASSRIGTPHLRTVYPPLAEWTFAANFEIAPSVPAFKRLFVLLDLASAGVLLLLLRARRLPLTRVIFYAWNPLVVTSFAASGHYDSLAIFTLLLMLLFTIKGRPILATMFLAASFLAKFFALILLPFVWKTAWQTGGNEPRVKPLKSGGYRRLRKLGPHLALLGGLVLAVYFPFVTTGEAIFSVLDHFVRHYENNAGLFRLLRWCGNSHLQAQFVAGVFLLGILAVLLKKKVEILQSALVLTAALVLFSPNAFPWYFTWAIPFLCFHPHPAWLLMSVTAVLGYAPVIEYTASGTYRDTPLILWLEYGPVFVLGIVLLIMRGGKNEVETTPRE